jgi:TFIIF-interacting CTD phosphatase-like protein
MNYDDRNTTGNDQQRTGGDSERNDAESHAAKRDSALAASRINDQRCDQQVWEHLTQSSGAIK